MQGGGHKPASSGLEQSSYTIKKHIFSFLASVQEGKGQLASEKRKHGFSAEGVMGGKPMDITKFKAKSRQQKRKSANGIYSTHLSQHTDDGP